MRINLSTIAQRMGLSVSTVSRALSDKDGIHEETRSQIKNAASQMGYATRRGRGRSEQDKTPSSPQHILTMSIHTAAIDQRYLTGMSGAAVTANVGLLSHLVADNQCASVLDPRTAPASLRSGFVKGIVLLHRWPKEVAAQIARKAPTVSIVHDYPEANIDLIGIDDRQGMAALVHHLHSAGHRRIGFYGLCPEVSWSSARYGAYMEALTRLDLEADARNVIRIDLPTALSPAESPDEASLRHVRARLSKGVDAWICSSSMTGRTLCRQLLADGLRLPADVSLASYHGGSFPLATNLPAITTTDVSDEELGATAVRRLLHRLECPSESRRSLLVPARLQLGATTRHTAAAAPRV